ncbi:nucleotidyltransferase family protein [Chitinophaga flava]|uniref:Nucleotidyltransferase family protein n=1 Tax=Chitinophaga flava TaxID=2259036 RepID=A0A365XRP8_9BACT|nr:nucleotidyltransferase family protein [Chitinophaga flava]RBL88820.1 nucleotidyltransferase family protein [Chitinophaga flava]
MLHTGIIILAAGASQRLGTPKQQVIYQQQSLLQRITDTALSIDAAPVVVVLGAYADNIRPDIDGSGADIIVNTNWYTGMGSTIQTGLSHLLRVYDNASDALLLLCDQPFITSHLLRDLISTHQQQHDNITACAYGNTTGTPVLFHKKYFPQLMALSGQEGAKKIILQHPDEVTTIPFPNGIIDIDTPDDLRKLL